MQGMHEGALGCTGVQGMLKKGNIWMRFLLMQKVIETKNL